MAVNFENTSREESLVLIAELTKRLELPVQILDTETVMKELSYATPGYHTEEVANAFIAQSREYPKQLETAVRAWVKDQDLSNFAKAVNTDISYWIAKSYTYEEASTLVNMAKRGDFNLG